MKHNTNLLLVLLGFALGWLVASQRPERKSRTRTQLAPSLEHDGDHLYQAGAEAKYAQHRKAVIHEMIQPNMTELEAHIAREEMQSLWADALRYGADLEQTRERRTDNVERWIGDLDDGS